MKFQKAMPIKRWTSLGLSVSALVTQLELGLWFANAQISPTAQTDVSAAL